MAYFEGDDNDNQIPQPDQNTSGDDTMYGRGGDDYLDGGGGNDTLVGGTGGDTLIGGAGIDTISYWDNRGAGVVVNLTTMTASGNGSDAQGDVISGFENIEGSDYTAGNDVLTGSAGVNSIWGLGGDDRIYGMAGDDILSGGTGNDLIDGGDGNDSIRDLDQNNQLYGGNGNDTIVAGGFNDTLDGGAGNDSLSCDTGSFYTDEINVLRGGAGADRIEGSGAKNDIATYSEGIVGVTVNLTTGAASGGNAQGDVLIGIEHLIGSAGNDQLTGSVDVNSLSGGAGNDILHGMDGNDRVDGGAGADALYGDFGSDTLTGGANADTLDGGIGNDSLLGGDDNDILRGGIGADRLDGGAGTDSVMYTESTAAVTINLASGAGSGGTAQGDVLVAIETVYGSSHNDTLVGNTAANGLVGGAGNDVLAGQGGKDTLIGGVGADRFYYGVLSDSPVGANADRITDFSHAQADRIDLHGIDANTGVAGDQAFHFIGSGAFTHHAGELRESVAGGVTTVSGDVNGDGVADFSVTLTGAITLQSGDFLL
ncbi:MULTISPECIES: calcium-binding protein [unclassified Inquilinus]|uniref:calcium-binding protein n=1 Tax=unclassified Inquilinus TaxID=2645927 RepID=UPI003F92ECC3